MELQTLTDFFMWCMIINLGIFLFWMIFLLATPDLVYRLQSSFFPLSRESYDRIIYGFLGAFKLMLLFFNVVPYVALRIIG